ncbi:hypothetical protein Dsin_002032 [Dipteronia sinensis]|uniref:BED-type domain-containing protein n=1 Tax=Dipteronia sinensis TaxID=43782 RepID=A0AAE0EJ03_9ROSI|nr:hypothetical protein Dsin_002032 [Dipteronia sinensis]
MNMKGKKKSECWLHFEEYVTKEEKKRARCKYCGDTYAFDSGCSTTNMNTHIGKRCKKYRPIDPTQKVFVKQPTISDFGSSLGSEPSDDLEFGRLKAIDKEDSLWGMKQQDEDINKRKSEWNNSLVKFPILSIIARDVFAIPVSTVASESAFSTNDRIPDPLRSLLTPKIVEGLILTGNWLQATCPIAKPHVVQEHAQNENESVHLLEQYINVETVVLFITFDDLEFGRLKATDKEDSSWGMKQQEEDINKRKMAYESAFSTNDHIPDPLRSLLTPKIVEGLILTENWLQATCPIAKPRVVQEHAQNENESVRLLEHYINVETEHKD